MAEKYSDLHPDLVALTEDVVFRIERVTQARLEHTNLVRQRFPFCTEEDAPSAHDAVHGVVFKYPHLSELSVFVGIGAYRPIFSKKPDAVMLVSLEYRHGFVCSIFFESVPAMIEWVRSNRV